MDKLIDIINEKKSDTQVKFMLSEFAEYFAYYLDKGKISEYMKSDNFSDFIFGSQVGLIVNQILDLDEDVLNQLIDKDELKQDKYNYIGQYIGIILAENINARMDDISKWKIKGI